MKVFVAGGTGAIGRPLIGGLLAKGHTVVALTRSTERASSLLKQGVEPVIADVLDPDATKAAVGRVRPEVVIEQLTSLPKTYTRESLKASSANNNRLRLAGGANVFAAAQAAGVRRYLRQSIAFWAMPGRGLADETTPLAYEASPYVSEDARVITELEAQLLGSSDMEGIALRYGFFYGPGTWFHPDGDVARQVREQQFPIVGNGEGVWSWLHIEDAAMATVAAAEKGKPGVYLVANDRPLPVRQWLPAFAQWLKAPPPASVSVEDALETSGADAVYYGTRMRGVSNAKAKRELGFQPRPLEWISDAADDSQGRNSVPPQDANSKAPPAEVIAGKSRDTSRKRCEVARPADLPRVVIVGGGFGGLYAARRLAGAPVTVTLIDKRNYHLFRPMLYQVATGLLSSDEIAAPIRSILRRQKNVTVLMAEVVGVDPDNHVVLTQNGIVAYDYLILATGIDYNYFGHEEWKTHAPGLASVDDADRIRAKILTAFETAEQLAVSGKDDPAKLCELLTFVQVGGGTAGVEMAATMAEMARMALAEDFRHIDPRSARIHLFEAAPRILKTYPEKLSEKARCYLEGIGIEVHTNTRVERVDEQGVVVNGRRIASRTVLWTAGVVASPAGRWLNADVDRLGRIKVNPDLSVPGHPNVFAIGDTAAITADTRTLFGFRSKHPEPLPGVAQVAIQGGTYVAGLIRRRVNGNHSPKPFWYWNKGNMAIVGRTFAVADLKHVSFTGFTAWLLWAGIHVYFLIGFTNRLLVMLQWAISLLTQRRGVRILPVADRAP